MADQEPNKESGLSASGLMDWSSASFAPIRPEPSFIAPFRACTVSVLNATLCTVDVVLKNHPDVVRHFAVVCHRQVLKITLQRLAKMHLDVVEQFF